MTVAPARQRRDGPCARRSLRGCSRNRVSGGLIDCLTCVASGFASGIALVPGASAGASAIAVSEDGARVYFTSPRRLVSGASTPGIYRFETVTGTCAAAVPFHGHDLGGAGGPEPRLRALRQTSAPPLSTPSRRAPPGSHRSCSSAFRGVVMARTKSPLPMRLVGAPRRLWPEHVLRPAGPVHRLRDPQRPVCP
jgi:hypothetical protein